MLALGGQGLVFTGALVGAMLIDRLWGEPPARWHPVVWMGRYLQFCGQRIAPCAAMQSPADDRVNQLHFSLGALAWLFGAVVVMLMAAGVQYVLLQAPGYWAAAGLAIALKPMLAWRMLRDEVQAVELALQDSLEAGRAQLARLVSRDTAQLQASEVREAAIESLAENLNDSVMAPVFWFVLLGLPGAAVYRFANTADAMWGYPGMRNGRWWQWAGKWAARADDVLSWLPARLTTWLLLLANSPMQLMTALVRVSQQARLTPSPNSGWPMAAMAHLLDVRLGKPDVYVLNAKGQAPNAFLMLQAQNYAQKALMAGMFIALLAIILVAQ